MNQSSAELKQTAKRALFGKYGISIGAIVIVYLVILVTASVIELPALTFLAVSRGNVGTLILISIVYALAVFAVGILEYFVLIGLFHFFYRICTGQPHCLEDLLFGVKNHPLKYLGLSLLMSLISLVVCMPILIVNVLGILMEYSIWMLWLYVPMYLVSIILMIFVMFRYALTFLILIEDPEKKVMSCLRESAGLMKGNQGRLFYLGLSFIGIMLLGYLSMGIGLLWILPYVCCTFICFYLDVKREKERLAKGR